MTAVETRWADLVRALGALTEPPEPEHARLAELLGLPGVPDGADHTTLFLLNLYPYASVHLGAEGMLGGDARDRVAGFWRALGMTPPAEPDHLGALLGLLAAILEREVELADPAERILLARTRQALLHEHLLSWLLPWLCRVRELGSPFYVAWSELLERVLGELTADGPGEAPLSGHLAEAPPLPDPRSGGEGSGEAFLQGLLAPVRSGLILTRADLARAGRTLGLGVRMGERAYVLKALLAQDAPAALAWLADEARRQADLDGSIRGPTMITTFWRDRALAAADLLDELASTEAHIHETSPEAGAEQPTEAHHA